MAYVEEVRAIVTQIDHDESRVGAGRVAVTYTSLDGRVRRDDIVRADQAPTLGEEFGFADDGSGQLLGAPRPLPPTEVAFNAWITRRMGRDDFEALPAEAQIIAREAFIAGRASR